MQMCKQWWQFSAARRWFMLALGLSGLFVVYTVIYATGILDRSTLSVEHWLLNRPIGRLDCVFFEWRHVGEAPVSLLLVLALGIICWRAGYSWKIIPILIILLLFCVTIEYIGKSIFILYLPPNLLSGMTDLACPQISKQPISVQLATMGGLWWKIPVPVAGQIRWVHTVAHLPVFAAYISSSSDDYIRGYPGGHAMRWCFLDLIATWLYWNHKKSQAGRILLTIVFVLISFFGGFMQFYIGVHVLTDTIAGYLLGAAAACCAIGFLNVYQTSTCFDRAEKEKYAKNRAKDSLTRSCIVR